MTTQNLIIRDFHGTTIRQRSDGYLCATDMCQATGKRLNDYKRLKSTKEYIKALASDTGIPASQIIQVIKGVTKNRTAQEQGTWIHPYASIHLAIWCSPDFAVIVTKWVFELLTKGTVSLNPNKPHQEITTFAENQAKKLDNIGIIGNAKQISLNNSIKEKFDLDILKILNIKSQPAEIQQALLIPSIIAKQIGLKGARLINVKLIEFGLQTKHYDNKDHLYYQLTEKGLKYGQYQEFSTGKISRRNIKWYESVLKLFQPPSPEIFKLV